MTVSADRAEAVIAMPSVNSNISANFFIISAFWIGSQAVPKYWNGSGRSGLQKIITVKETGPPFHRISNNKFTANVPPALAASGRPYA